MIAMLSTLAGLQFGRPQIRSVVKTRRLAPAYRGGLSASLLCARYGTS
jgi:hypothetical protein